MFEELFEGVSVPTSLEVQLSRRPDRMWSARHGTETKLWIFKGVCVPKWLFHINWADHNLFYVSTSTMAGKTQIVHKMHMS